MEKIFKLRPQSEREDKKLEYQLGPALISVGDNRLHLAEIETLSIRTYEDFAEDFAENGQIPFRLAIDALTESWPDLPETQPLELTQWRRR